MKKVFVWLTSNGKPGFGTKPGQDSYRKWTIKLSDDEFNHFKEVFFEMNYAKILQKVIKGATESEIFVRVDMTSKVKTKLNFIKDEQPVEPDVFFGKEFVCFDELVQNAICVEIFGKVLSAIQEKK